jgi:PBP1b-binding outer membrane lipoprotein LpoB
MCGVMMKKIILLSLIITMLTAGCSAETLSKEKLRDIDFTVVDEDDIP